MMEVQQFYSNQCVLVTGATGFLGKAVVEKLLRSCPQVDTIYILIRSKAGWSAKSRLTQLLDNPLFDKLKNENPDAIKKICPFEGDIGLPNLGLKLKEKSLLISKVNVVIHSAATVKFDEPLDHSLNLNVLGVKRVVELCKQMKNLKALVHISTAYANCDQRGIIEEKVYPHPPGGLGLLHLLNDIDIISSNAKWYEGVILKGRPNTYTYTKALAENYLMSEAKSLPFCIVRPSIVTASLKEPVPGWIDNVNGATGIIAGFATGVLRLLMLDTSKHLNMIPVDVVVNLILCAAMETSLQDNRLEFPKVYNSCSSDQNQIRNSELFRLVRHNILNWKPSPGTIWSPYPLMTTNKFWYTANDFIFQYLPALLIDSFMSNFATKGFRLLDSYQKMKKATGSLEFFTLNEWQFATENMTQLFKKLTDEDQKRFYFNVDNINWSNYIKRYCKGIKKFILKPKDTGKREIWGRLPPLYLIHSAITFIMLVSYIRVRYKCWIRSNAFGK